MTSKIEVGDKVHLEFTVSKITDGGFKDQLLTLTRRNKDQRVQVHGIFMGDPAIVKHIPKPYEPEADDIVRLIGGDGSLWKIVAIHHGRAWCRNIPGGIDRFCNFGLLKFVSKG